MPPVFSVISVAVVSKVVIYIVLVSFLYTRAGNTKGGSITVLLTSGMTGLELVVWQLTFFLFLFAKQTNNPNQSNRRYSDTSPFSIPWLEYGFTQTTNSSAKESHMLPPRVNVIKQYSCNLLMYLFFINWPSSWNFEFVKFWVCQILSLSNFDFVKFWVCQIWVHQISSSSNFEFIKFWSRQILSSWNFEFVKFWVREIMSLSNFEFVKFWVCQILSSSNFEFIKFWVCQILSLSNFEFVKFWVCQTNIIW